MAKLTKRAIDGFKHAGGWDVRWDTDVPGFGVRIYPTGKKAFVLSYRVQGRKRLMVLGTGTTTAGPDRPGRPAPGWRRVPLPSASGGRLTSFRLEFGLRVQALTGHDGCRDEFS